MSEPHPFHVEPDALSRVDWSAPDRTSGLGRGVSLLDFGGAFWERAVEARGAGDDALARAYDVLEGVCRMRLDPEDDDLPLGGGPDDPLGPSFLPEQLPGSTVDAVEGVLDGVDDVWLRARLADVVHAGRGRDHHAAERAARALGEAAWASWAEEREHATAVLLDRAFQVTGPYGPRSTARAAATGAWNRLRDHAAGADIEPADLNALLVLGLKYGVGEADAIAPESERAAERAEAKGYWHLARQGWAATSQWWHRAGNDDRAGGAMGRAAATYEREADGLLGGTSDVRHIQAAEPLRRAITAYRRAGKAEKAAEVHRRLQEVQRAARAEHARWAEATRTTVDLTEIATVGADAVRGLPLGEALVALATLLPIPSKETRLEETAEALKRYVLSSMFEPRLVNHEGKLTARAQTLWARAVQEETQRMRLLGAGALAGARRQLYEEHALGHLQLYATLMHSAWVPPGRSGAYTRALLAGYRGDWDVMVALLCPQIEHSVRALLHERAGKSTSSLGDDGIQKEYGLSALTWPEAEAILGADVTFALRVLLVDATGANLRNQWAHGLLPDGALDAGLCEYLWWLTLRLCLFPPPAPAEGGGETAPTTDDGRERPLPNDPA